MVEEYRPRIVDGDLAARLGSAGAVLIEGPRACGKTATGRHHAASAVLLDVDAGLFSARFNEVRGDIHVALGDPTSARTAYNAALSTTESDLVDRNLVQMKLDDLPAAASGATAQETAQ